MYVNKLRFLNQNLSKNGRIIFKIVDLFVNITSSQLVDNLLQSC